MGTLQSLRKAYGALKDSTKVGLAKVNSEFKDLDIAIVKATNHVEGPPKERHVRKVFAATSGVRPQADVAYCIHSLARRLGKTRNWVVALKTLIVIHRTLREGEPTFREELLNYSHRGHVLRLSNFKDDSSPLAWDCSAWVRTYALFLEERLECFRVLKYDIEAERLTKSSDGPTKGHCRTRNLASEDLLEHLPALQQLLHRLVGCQPDGGAFHNYLIQYALALVLKESFKIYCAINDGIINLVDMFFEMSRHEAVKALEIYRRAGQQAANLSDFYESCKGLDLARNFQFPTLRQPPPSFLTTMEEYIREAPRTRSVSNKTLEYQETKALPYKPEEASPSESQKSTVEADAEALVEAQESPQPENEVPSLPVVTPDTGDLLGLNDINPNASEIELSNALSLAIVSPDAPKFSESGGLMLGGSDPSGWELALVTTTSSNSSHVAESKLAGGFDRLLLDSLYDHAVRPQNAGYGAGPMANPFDQQDPFSMSNHIAPPPNVQMAVMAQQQQQHQQPTMVQNPHYPLHQPEHQPQQMMMMQQPHYPLQTQQQMMQNHYQPQQQVNSANPFGDPFTSFPPSAPHGNPNLI